MNLVPAEGSMKTHQVYRQENRSDLQTFVTHTVTCSLASRKVCEGVGPGGAEICYETILKSLVCFHGDKLKSLTLEQLLTAQVMLDICRSAASHSKTDMIRMHSEILPLYERPRSYSIDTKP